MDSEIPAGRRALPREDCKPVKRTRSQHTGGRDDVFFRQMIHDAFGFSVRLLEIRNRLGEMIGLSGPAFSILIAIRNLSQDSEVGITRVGEHLHQSGAFVTLEVAKLVKAGLVDKYANPNDGRRVILKVTDKACVLLKKLAETQRPVNDAIFAELSADQFHMFAETITKLVAGAETGLALLRYMEQQRSIISDG